MARKITYRHRIGTTGETAAQEPKQKRNPNPEVQTFYNEGQVILIDKPIHWTSFDVVRRLRGQLQIKKIGHAGTLDPLATGLLILCTGKNTKQINTYMGQEKEYTGHFVLGAVTPTYDLESSPEHLQDAGWVQINDCRKAAQTFTGSIMQVPPIYSAIKKDGVAAYELARRGTDVELAARPVVIHEFEITALEQNAVYFRVVCSTGTYIRSLAHDFGKALGCGAYLGSLRRTRIGEFRVTQALTPEEFIGQLAAQFPDTTAKDSTDCHTN